ncbi:MAG: hypothetical protein ACUVTX_03805 [Bacteroidales bacterium]
MKLLLRSFLSVIENMKFDFNCRILFLIFIFLFPFIAVQGQEEIKIDKLSVMTVSRPTQRQVNSIRVFTEEIEKRSYAKISVSFGKKTNSPYAVFVSLADRWNELAAANNLAKIDTAKYKEKEGYHIWTEIRPGRKAVCVAGNDERGLLFGLGYLLRKMEIREKYIVVPSGLRIKTSPQYSLRGHQLGYRAKSNSYDGWTPEMMEQYIRELAIFGTNAIELIPPRSDDSPSSPHFPIPPMDMMVKMSEICDKYGLDVWIWYPAIDDDYSKPETIESALAEWGGVFSKLPRVDAVFVPCGDPGRTPPEILFPMLEKQAHQLKELHPVAEWWVSPQGFDKNRMEKFHELISEKPPWLTGIVYGPWTRMSLPDFRKWIPDMYPVRFYPDITHALNCQFPVYEWDMALGLTAGREPIMPRPRDMQAIFKLLQRNTFGFISYSEGCSDDVNKFVWSSLGWDENSDLMEILKDYSRFFIGPDYEEKFAYGLLDLESNWKGPLITNENVSSVLSRFIQLEKSADEKLLSNWRFQQALFRAYYDAYTRNRLIFETATEKEALELLRNIPEGKADNVISDVIEFLDHAEKTPVSSGLKARILELGEELYNSIRMQLDTKKYKAGRPDGAMLDRLNVPLNNSLWLKKRLSELLSLSRESEKTEGINEIIDWKNPGFGGFYDNLGVPFEQPHLLKGKSYFEDPYFLSSPLTSPSSSLIRNPMRDLPDTWRSHVKGLYDIPVRLYYEELVPGSDYKVRVVYNGGPIRLFADSIEIHGYLNQPFSKLEFSVPRDVTKDGKLLLEWFKTPGEGHGGWGNEICEVWLINISQKSISNDK